MSSVYPRLPLGSWPNVPVWIGKSSLINHAFGIDLATVAHGRRGKCNIEDEIISNHNSRFVLHDSMGFEPGNTKEFETAKEFFKSRGKRVPVKDRVHAIWCAYFAMGRIWVNSDVKYFQRKRLCIKIPHAGSRVFETGNEEFLKLTAAAKGNTSFCKYRTRAIEFDTTVPVVVVFTQFDILYSGMEMALTDEEMKLPGDQLQRLCSTRAESEFKNIYRPALADLIRTTLNLKGETSGFVVWITSAIAQRASAQANIEASIKIGMKTAVGSNGVIGMQAARIPYNWRGIASSTKFPGFKLENCLNTIHFDIVTPWNFNDPNDLLRSKLFLEKMQTIMQTVVPSDDEVKTWFGTAKYIFSAASAVSGATHPLVFPIVAGIGLSGMFIKWIATVYQRTSAALRAILTGLSREVAC
ncbi:hypothetical protein C8R45DRAFT_944147 [Mycena sanguinolenta]|nr:hypothetical protein C8R45DRAFT_944147 [Mycena sanguinolenta]